MTSRKGVALRRPLELLDQEPPHDARLESLAAWINQAHFECQEFGSVAMEKARLCGQWLHDAKAAVPHGQWLAWLKASVSFTPRTAQLYMKIAANWDTINEQCETISHFTLVKACKLVAEPERPTYVPIGNAHFDQLKEFACEFVASNPKLKAKRERAVALDAEAESLAAQSQELRKREQALRRMARRLFEELEEAARAAFAQQDPQADPDDDQFLPEVST